jgi:cellulose biosynthesis protein BcsQ
LVVSPNEGNTAMNVVAVVSCRGGTGKTTLTAHLASHAMAQGLRCLVVDADPRGSFALYNSRRAEGALPAATAVHGIDRQLAVADVLGYDWVLIDTPPGGSVAVEDAVLAAAMVIIPARPGFLDLAAVRETAEFVRIRNKPHAVVLNGAPAKVEGNGALIVAESRDFLDKYAIPVWSGQISERTDFAPSVGQADARLLAMVEIAQLWSMIERAVEAMNAAKVGAVAEAQAA